MAKRPSHEPPAIVWFRDDLRLADHPALQSAVETGQPLLLIYVLDDETPRLRRIGGASRWWLHHALRALDAEIERRGATLHVFSGAALEVVPRIVQESGATAIFWSHRYEAAEVAIDRAVDGRLTQLACEVHTFNGSLGHEPGEIQPQTGGWYKVYSAFWKASEAMRPLDAPLPAPARLDGAAFTSRQSNAGTIEGLGLLPKMPDWAGGLAKAWQPGEAEALRKLRIFASTKVADYGVDRDLPAVEGSSRLSPHLRFGEISPRQVLAAVKHLTMAQKFRQEMTWRDFTYDILAHVPDLGTRSYDERFSTFPWRKAPEGELRAWRRGLTGYPIVDAGMRQLWQTGWMHNRVRMITASFLVKHLLVDWRVGEAWFWDTLCDADPANNGVNWQWVAGTGPDASPFFRIFNPVVQGEKFDPEGAYVKTFVPELGALPSRWIHKPWVAPAAALRDAGVVLGTSYPCPIVDHAEARQRALEAFATLRKTPNDPASGDAARLA